MCQILHHAELEIETIGELRKLMPKLVKDPRYTATPEPLPASYDDSCLCPLDLIATGAANGFKVEAKDGDYVARVAGGRQVTLALSTAVAPLAEAPGSAAVIGAEGYYRLKAENKRMRDALECIAVFYRGGERATESLLEMRAIAKRALSSLNESR